MPSSDVVIAPVKILGLPEEACFTTFEEFLLALEQFLVVEVPRSVTNVIFSSQEPAADQRNYLWVRSNNAGSILGLYVFTGGAWQQLSPPPQQVIWMYGDSANIPAGYQLVDGTNPNFTAPQVTHIQTFFYPTPGTPPYSYFAVTYSGF